MTNNLRKLQKDLCSFAKRCKNFKYTDSALITFLITGTFLSTNNSFSETEDSDLKIQRQTISTSIKDIHKNLKKTKMENDKLLKNTNLELIQLMEQGEHVVKSPWSNWQYGVNYFSNNWNRTFKGRGDKEYYRGIFTRSNNIFQRSIHTSSTHYSSLATGNDSTQASSNLNGKNVLHFGTTDLRMVEEPIVEVEVSAGVKPRQPKKMEPLTIGINHNLNFSVPELPDFEVPDEKVITGKTTPSSANEIPNFGASALYSKNLITRVELAPQVNDKSIAPIQNTDISNGKIDITFDGKIKTVGANKAIDEENSTMKYSTQAVTFVGKIRGVTNFTYPNYTHNSRMARSV